MLCATLDKSSYNECIFSMDLFLVKCFLNLLSAPIDRSSLSFSLLIIKFKVFVKESTLLGSNTSPLSKCLLTHGTPLPIILADTTGVPIDMASN